ncbi:polyketide synthase dehydratase domain-containing protein [Clostridium estertheticum]|uniref:beta-ketoacyl synthase N-terminal-like domain-containing protein n=1 Tax=Clostridium estertheticum TaxID=238834 RepID=UPI0013EE6C04|nr:beta-ketoacyl synthase N-terminal-like domain-containing protein [Clostridium estertheticum]MBZ9609085.1 polyketide synthase dehydratase domain-containing protein [Clostridium estertheticum]
MSERITELNKILNMIKGEEIDPEQGYELISEIKNKHIKVEDKINKNPQKDNELHDYVVNYLKNLLSQVIGLSVNKINAKQSLEEYGVDSVAIMEINTLLDNDFETIPKTLLFEYTNLYELAYYFVDNHKGILEKMVGVNNPQNREYIKDSGEVDKVNENRFEELRGYRKFTDTSKYTKNDMVKEVQEDEDIAIVGISGMFPKSNNLNEFWSNLKNGVDCITEIPFERWDHSKYYDPEKGKKGKAYSKWGGFIDYYNCFDPLFFQMTPKDAELIDPQERIFLECVHGAIEDGGYTRNSLWNTKTGVFVGIMYGHYQLYGAEESVKGNVTTLSSSYASIANRVSYYFNFNGPSIAMDTMCSSSLTALHLACESIHRGDSEIAIAGGVNLTIHPDKYLFLCNQRFASSEGKCRAFGNGGDGYVPGEGVGALLLKSISKAKKDNDNIYGVIKSTSINHGGKTNGYTVPNPNAQAAVILDALKKSKVNPRAISYIEAHGTGTSLGDPIEVTGLTKAFRQYKPNNQYCAIGSVKTNVGHLESAAGVVSIIKVLLQMKYKQLVPSIHSEVLNSNIDFETTPFYVQRSLDEWKVPKIEENGIVKEVPRCAAISSFGAGGTNVHIILEEYKKDIIISEEVKDKQLIFTLSAKNKERLREYVNNILAFIEDNTTCVRTTQKIKLYGVKESLKEDITKIIIAITKALPSDINVNDSIEEYGVSKEEMISITETINEYYSINIHMGMVSVNSTIESISDHIFSRYESSILERYTEDVKCIEDKVQKYNFNLKDMIYTLQIGRQSMDERLAIIVSSISDLKEKLSNFIEGKKNISDLYLGNINNSSDIYDLFLDSEEGNEFLNSLVHSGKLDHLCKLWTSGVNYNWDLLYTNNKPNKISLPTYPFERKAYWYNKSTDGTERIENNKVKPLAAVIDFNESVFEEQCYKKILTKDDLYLRDHVVKGNMVLPGVVYLEMVWKAGTLSTREGRVRAIRDVNWRRPIEFKSENDKKEIYIGLYPEEEDVKVNIYSINEDGNKIIHFTCVLDYEDTVDEDIYDEKIDIQQIINRSKEQIDKSICYGSFSDVEIEYGENFRVIESLYKGENETLSKLVLPNNSKMQLKDFIIHPSFADGAMQTALCSIILDNKQGGTYVPFALKKVEVCRPITSICYCFVTTSDDIESDDDSLKLDLFLLDELGNVVIKFKCLSGKDFNTNIIKKEIQLTVNEYKDSIEDMLTKLLTGEVEIDEVEKLLEEI